MGGIRGTGWWHEDAEEEAEPRGAGWWDKDGEGFQGGVEGAIDGKVEEGARASNSWYLLLHGNKRYI